MCHRRLVCALTVRESRRQSPHRSRSGFGGRGERDHTSWPAGIPLDGSDTGKVA